MSQEEFGWRLAKIEEDAGKEAGVYDGTAYNANGRYLLVRGKNKGQVMREEVVEYAMHGVALQGQHRVPRCHIAPLGGVASQ